MIQEFHGCDFATARVKVSELGVTVSTAGSEAGYKPQRSKLAARRTRSRSALVRKRYGRS